MNPPVTGKGQATRERILGAAAELMRTQGVAASSQGAIEQAAGAGRSQLYHYFADRDALIEAVVDRNGRALAAGAASAMRGKEGLAAFDAWFDAAIAANTTRGGAGGCPLGSLASQLAETGEEHRAKAQEMFALWLEPVTQTLELMLDRGQLRAGTDVRQLADQIMSAMQGGLLLAQVRRDPRSLATALAGARQLVTDAIE